MGWWERNVVPRIVDKALGTEWVHEQRALVCDGLGGRVLEIGFGSGHNVRHYPDGVTEVAAGGEDGSSEDGTGTVDPSDTTEHQEDNGE